MRTAQAGFKRGQGGENTADLLEKLGPTVLVDIGSRSRAPPGEPPDLPLKKVRALIDTGAGGECIDDTPARTPGLPVADEGLGSAAAVGPPPTSPGLYPVPRPPALPALHGAQAGGRKPVAPLHPEPEVPAAIPGEL